MIEIFSKKGCGKCVAAKEKLERMKLVYTSHDLEYHTTYHPGWRTDGSVDATAAHNFFNDLPLLKINEKWYNYSQAMKELKRIVREKGNENFKSI